MCTANGSIPHSASETQTSTQPTGHYIHIEEGIIELTFFPATTAALTRILEAQLSAAPLDDADLAACATLAALFRSATMAGVQQTGTSPRHAGEIEQALAELGLG